VVTPSRRARRRILAAVALALAIAVVVVLVLRSHRPSSGAAQAAGSTGLGVATVSRRDLVETDTESGTLAYAGAQTVYNRLSGTITWLPKVGQVVRPGQILFRVTDQPVMLMSGSTPAYRDLAPSDSPGPDIGQLNRNLIKLGFDAGAIVADDEWQVATSDGVELLQESLDEAPTGTLALGQVVFLPGPQLVSSVDASVGGTGGGGGGDSSGGGAGSGGSSDAGRVGAGRPAPELVSLQDDAGSGTSTSTATSTTSTSTTPSTSTTTTTSSTTPPPATSSSTSTTTSSRHATTTGAGRSTGAGPAHGTPSPTEPAGASPAQGTSDRSLSHAIGRLSSEVARLRAELRTRQAADHSSSPGHGGASGASSDPGATEVLQTSSTRLDVTVDLPAGSQSEATVGRTVDVLMPAGNTVKGTIVSVSRVAQTSSSGSSGSGGAGDSGSGSTVPVTIRLHNRRAGAGLDQAAVSVDFVQASARHVLSVPVTALVATSGESYALQEAAAPHRLIAVHTGLFAAGYVEVSGPGVVPGLRVTNSEG
jgi:hypothetical protein